MNNERIDLTQFEKMIETANDYMGRWFKGTVLPSGDKWRSIKDLGLHVDWSHNEVFGPLVEEFPSLIAELKRCYNLIDRYDSTVSLLSYGEDSTGCNGDLTVVKLSACHALYDLRDLSQRVS